MFWFLIYLLTILLFYGCLRLITKPQNWKDHLILALGAVFWLPLLLTFVAICIIVLIWMSAG